MPGVDTSTAADELAGQMDAGISFDRVGEDSFIGTRLGFGLAFGKLQLGFQVPVRFRVIDDPPETDDVLRTEDWDEFGDWLKIIQYIQWSHPRDTFYLRAGELVGVEVGHGTIVQGYNNVVDVNHWQWGIHSAVNITWGGMELLLDNIADPELFGTRTYIRPYSFVDPESFWQAWAIGFSAVGDVAAPTRLQLDADGTYGFDEEENLLVDETEGTWILGVDMELEVVRTEMVSIVPYMDMNFHLKHGQGFHLGTYANFTFSEAFALNSRLEFRALGEGYIPGYFDGLYEVQRLLYLPLDATGQRRPKLQVLEFAPEEALVGYFGSLTFGIMDMIYLTLAYEDYRGDNNSSVLARLSLPEVGPIRLGAYYINRNFDGLAEMFDLDNALLVTELRAEVASPFYILGQYSRRFSAREDGTYEPVDDWSIGAGVSFDF